MQKFLPRMSSNSLVPAAFLLLIGIGATTAWAQQPAAASPQTLTVQTKEKSEAIPADAFKGMPHKVVAVRNEHTNADEKYSGVLVSDLLARVDAPLGRLLHGKALALYVVAEGTDGYKAVYSLAEIDPSFHSGEVIVADLLNGQSLGKDGPYKLVNTEDKHPARWVRNLASLSVLVAQ
jgi:hypothetical protein